MNKDEMKNRISLALTDPILQQGFEIICKENAELKADNDARKFAMAMSEKVEKQLREENAELQKKIRCECTRCVYSDTPCILSDYGKDKNGICDHFKDVFDELTLTNNECKEMREELRQRIRENQKLCEQIEKMQETLKSDLIARLKEQMQYSTSPSCTKGMELFIKSIEKWEIKEND